MHLVNNRECQILNKFHYILLEGELKNGFIRTIFEFIPQEFVRVRPEKFQTVSQQKPQNAGPCQSNVNAVYIVLGYFNIN